MTDSDGWNSRLLELQKENHKLQAKLHNRSSSFCSKIIDFIESLHLSETHSDLHFHTPEAEIPGHTFVLAARGGKWTLENNVLNLGDYEQDVCDAIIHWIYKGTVRESNNVSFLCRLMTVSVDHDLAELFSSCEQLLISKLNTNTCICIFDTAYKSKANNLLQRCVPILSEIWDGISPEDVQDMSCAALQSILENKCKFPLHSAIHLQRVDTALLILNTNPIEMKNRLNSLDDSGHPPLYLALRSGQIDFANQLLRLGAEHSIVMKHEGIDRRIAEYAVLNGEYLIAQFLVKCLPEAGGPSGDEYSSLLHLLAADRSAKIDCEQARQELIATLIDKANASTLDSLLNTPIHVALLNKNAHIFTTLLKKPGKFNLDAANHLGHPPLWLALILDFANQDDALFELSGFSVFTHPSTPTPFFVDALVQAGANVNFCFADAPTLSTNRMPKPGDTLLMAAARCGLESAALYMLQHTKCSVNAESTVGSTETVFHVAIEAGLKRLCHELAVTYHADPNRLRSLTVQLEVAATKPIHEGVMDLSEPIHLSPDTPPPMFHSISSSNTYGPTPFDEENQSTYNLPNSGGVSSDSSCSTLSVVQKHTPLHLAVCCGMEELVSLYLDRKAWRQPDWLILDHAGESVFSLALWNGHMDLADRILIAATWQYGALISSHADGNKKSSTKSVITHLGDFTAVPSLLHRAVQRENADAVRFLLRHKPDINDSLGQSNSTSLKPGAEITWLNNPNSSVVICPLWHALSMNNLEIADLLVANGADVDFWSNYLNTTFVLTLLHRAIDMGMEVAAKFLIKNNCDVNAVPSPDDSPGRSPLPIHKTLRPHSHWSPLHMAVAMGEGSVVQSLLRNERTDVNRQDIAGCTALHLSVQTDNIEVVQTLLTSSSIDCSLKDKSGHTAFHAAMECRNVEASKALLKQDSSLALQTDNNGRNFLHVALQNKDREAVFFLIQTGMDMNQPVRNPTKYTPLHLAILSGVPEDLLRSLVLAGASISSRTAQKHTPLHLCVLHNQPDLIPTLVENGAQLNDLDAESNTPLHLAVRSANIPCVGILLGYDQTDTCIPNIRGQLPIHLLCKHDAATAVELLHHLLEVCATSQLDAKDAAGDTPLLMAYRAGIIPLCIELVHAGASLGVSNADGQSVFSLSRLRTGSPAPDRILSQILDCLMQEPCWEDGVTCLQCNAKFGLTNRKHHCRHCGRLLCNQCSNFEIPIVKFHVNKPVRVCETCFQFLNNPLGI